VVGTRRYALPGNKEQVAAELTGLCAEVADRTGLSLRVGLQEVGPPYALDTGEPVIAAVRRGFSRATGRELPLAGAGAVGNATDFVAAGVPAVYHGVNQATAHSDDEHVTGSDLLRAARVYAASIVEFCGLVGLTEPENLGLSSGNSANTVMDFRPVKDFPHDSPSNPSQSGNSSRKTFPPISEKA
jgi:acetylornithine deacetylase/succinyl-diaminopimelate desuccinylase-like protein